MSCNRGFWNKYTKKNHPVHGEKVLVAARDIDGHYWCMSALFVMNLTRFNKWWFPNARRMGFVCQSSDGEDYELKSVVYWASVPPVPVDESM